MQVQRQSVCGTTVLELNGGLSVDLSAQSAAVLRTAIAAELNAGCRQVVLDLRGVDSMDAMGLGEIVRAFNTVRSRGGRLWLSRPSARVDRLLSITKLRTVIDVDPGQLRIADRGSARPHELGSARPASSRLGMTLAPAG